MKVKIYLDSSDLKQMETKILAASFKSVEQITKALLYGADSCTINSDLLSNMIHHEFILRDNKQFNDDWNKLNIL